VNRHKAESPNAKNCARVISASISSRARFLE
jgi:hypothetical protein